MDILKIAAFSDGNTGGNPAGVVIEDALPPAAQMQAIAADVGFSETAFAAPHNGQWRVRYFSPKSEVPFCGHATIALGAALSIKYGGGDFTLTLNDAGISVSAHKDGKLYRAQLQSPPTNSVALSADITAQALEIFGYEAGDLDPRLPPARAHGGANHFIFALKTRPKLAAMEYDLETGRRFMKAHDINATICFIYAQSAALFHSRNPFASGGVYEDPATGAAAAALAGYLHDINWPHEGAINITQGEDMGMCSRLRAEFTNKKGSSVRVSGTARII